MPFSVKRFLKRVDLKARKIADVQPDNVNLTKVEVLEEIQEVTIPVYEPEPIKVAEYEVDSDTEIDIIPVQRRKIKNKDIVRKVALNPLSE